MIHQMAKRCDAVVHHNSMVTALVAEHAIAKFNFDKRATMNIRLAITKCRARRRSAHEHNIVSKCAAPGTVVRSRALAILLASAKQGNASYMKVARLNTDTGFTIYSHTFL